MNALRSTHSRDSGAFTLIEILAATSILALMVIVLAQLASLSSKSMDDGMRRADNFTKARACLNLYATDIACAVLRQDLGAFRDDAGTHQQAFFTLRPGIGGDRSLSLVAYRTQPTGGLLERACQTITWNDAAPIGFGFPDRIPRFSSLTVADYQTVANGVIATAFYFVDSEGAYRPQFESTYTNKANGDAYLPGETPAQARAVGFALVSVDETTFNLLQLTGKLGNLSAEFSIQSPQVESYQTHWNNRFNQPSVVSNYPEAVRKGLRVFERIVPLPQS